MASANPPNTNAWPEWPVACPESLAVGQGEALLFAWPIDAADDAAWQKLSGAERERAARFRFKRDRVAFVAARAGLRRVLGGLLGVSPQSVEFTEGEFGKPRLAGDHSGHAVRFNLSHSGGWATAAVAESMEVGVDIEQIQVGKPMLHGVAERCFTAGERDALAAAGHAAAVFYRLWTRKEAIVKLLGDGLRAPLRAFAVPADESAAAWVDLPGGNRLGSERCWLESLEFGPSFSAALACERAPTAVRCVSLSE